MKISKSLLVCLCVTIVCSEYVVINRFKPVRETTLQLNCTLVPWNVEYNNTKYCWMLDDTSDLERYMMYASERYITAVFIKTIYVGRAQYMWSGQDETHSVYLIETNQTLNINQTLDTIELSENKWTDVFDSQAFCVFLFCTLMSYTIVTVYCLMKVMECLIYKYKLMLLHMSFCTIFAVNTFKLAYGLCSVNANRTIGEYANTILGVSSFPWIIFVLMQLIFKHILNSRRTGVLLLSALVLILSNFAHELLLSTTNTSIMMIIIISSNIMYIMLFYLSVCECVKLLLIIKDEKKRQTRRIVYNIVLALCNIATTLEYVIFVLFAYESLLITLILATMISIVFAIIDDALFVVMNSPY